MIIFCFCSPNLLNFDNKWLTKGMLRSFGTACDRNTLTTADRRNKGRAQFQRLAGPKIHSSKCKRFEDKRQRSKKEVFRESAGALKAGVSGRGRLLLWASGGRLDPLLMAAASHARESQRCSQNLCKESRRRRASHPLLSSESNQTSQHQGQGTCAP